MPTIRINDPHQSPAHAETNSAAGAEPPVPGQTPKALGLNLSWTPKAKEAITSILSRYPKDRSQSALIPLLHLAQKEFGGWVSVDAMQLVADTLGLPYIRIYEVATFYTMFNLKPVGQFHVQVCTNCACMVRGSDGIVQAVKEFTGIKHSGESSYDGRFTFTEVECLGACVDAPMMQVGTHYYTNLDSKKVKKILTDLKKGAATEHVDTPQAPIDPISHQSYTE